MEPDDNEALPHGETDPEILAEILAIENQDPADISEWFSQEMLDYEQCHRNSGNPIYVWLAIAIATKNYWQPVYGKQLDVGIPV